VKPGARALGVAESYSGDTSTLAGVVTRVDRVVDGFVFGSCTVGGLDSTTALIDLFERLGREDLQYLLLAGIAPAWYNVVDLDRLHDAVGMPVLSVSFEESEGLEPAISDAFDGEEAERRLDVYRSLPARHRVEVNDEAVFVRAVGIDEAEAARVVRAYTPEGGRPEPLRVARLAARAAEEVLPDRDGL
jgi:endonuclease V-like protein UPF0215 family